MKCSLIAQLFLLIKINIHLCLSIILICILFLYWPRCSAFWDWLLCERYMLSQNESLKIEFGTDLIWEACLWTLKTCLDRQHARFGNKLHSLCVCSSFQSSVWETLEKLQHATSSSTCPRAGGAPHDSCAEERWRSRLLSHSSLSLTHAFIWDQQHLLMSRSTR